MELLADRSIAKGQPLLHPDGTAILKPNGNPKDTNAKEGRVYQYIRQSGAYTQGHSVQNVGGIEQHFLVGADMTHPGYKPGTRLISLWDIVRAAYAVRNRVAHEGFFSEDHIDGMDDDQVIAADLIKNTPIDPRQWIRDAAWLAIKRELHKATP
jgi:hypothetical protein